MLEIETGKIRLGGEVTNIRKWGEERENRGREKERERILSFSLIVACIQWKPRCLKI